MTSRERVLTALRHKEPDRVPFDLSATPVTGIHRVAYRKLRKALDLPNREPRIWHLMQQLAWVEDDVHDAMRTDAKGLRPDPPSDWKLQITEDVDYFYYTDEWEIGRRRQKPDGYYYDFCQSPLAHAETPSDIERFCWPDPVDNGRFEGLRQLAGKAKTGDRAFILGGISAGMLEMGLWLRGFEDFFCDLAGNRSVTEALCDKIIELKMCYWSKALPLFGDAVDIIQGGDDYGGLNGLMINPSIWRAVFKPRLATLMGHIKKLKPNVFIFFHSCGSIHDIIPDLIEVGVEVLNPVQVAAANMDSAILKREFGKDISFWGGGVDTQRVLPNGTPEEVREEVKRRIHDLAPGGGFVFTTAHNIQADVPSENILAMREAVDEFGGFN